VAPPICAPDSASHSFARPSRDAVKRSVPSWLYATSSIQSRCAAAWRISFPLLASQKRTAPPRSPVARVFSRGLRAIVSISCGVLKVTAGSRGARSQLRSAYSCQSEVEGLAEQVLDLLDRNHAQRELLRRFRSGLQLQLGRRHDQTQSARSGYTAPLTQNYTRASPQRRGRAVCAARASGIFMRGKKRVAKTPAWVSAWSRVRLKLQSRSRLCCISPLCAMGNRWNFTLARPPRRPLRR
jgi:hypothetical protein